MNNYERKANEKFRTYLKRIVDAKSEGHISYKEMGDWLLEDGNRYSDDNIRKAYYVLKQIAEKLEEDTEYTDDDAFIELENLKMEVYKEKVKLRDQRRELNKILRKDARFENLRDIMTEHLEELGRLTKIEVKPMSKKEVGATLMLGDMHYGTTVDTQFNYYDTEVCRERFWQVINKTIEYCKVHKVTHLNVELLGDMVSGIIHVETQVSNEEDVIAQIVNVSELLANGIQELANNIPMITVYSVYGNHARVNPNKKDSINCENFERLIPEFLKLRLNGVKVIDSKSDDFIKYNAFGKTFVISHGDKDKVGTVVADYQKMFKNSVDEVHMGHFHSFKYLNESDIPVVINGTLMGGDNYALSIRKTGNAMQTLIVYGNDECVYKLYVD